MHGVRLSGGRWLIKDKLGRLQFNFLATVSKNATKSLNERVRSLEFHKRPGAKIEMIAEVLNPMVRGWMNYFGRYNKSAMKKGLDCVQRRMLRWAMCKYKHFRRHRQRAEKWLNQIKKRDPKMFEHWALS